MPTESELRLHRACFTGHRPHKLHQPESVVIAALGGSLALLLVPYIKKKIAEKKALEALGGLGDSDE